MTGAAGSEAESAEFVPEWDVYRDAEGLPVTITEEQFYAIWHAVRVVEDVRRSESYPSLWATVNGRTEWR